MKFSQIAIYHPDHRVASANIAALFGEKTYTDSLKMMGVVKGTPVGDMDLTLTFAHNLFKDVEIEYISSESEHHWHHDRIEENPDVPFLSHLGVYCERDEFTEYFNMFSAFGCQLLQLTSSYAHTHKRVGDKRKSSRAYKDAIFDTEHMLGFNVKLSCKE